MTPERWQQLKSLFTQAVDMGASEQSRFIQALSEKDPEIEVRLRSLIAHHRTATSLLDGPILSQERISEYLSSGMRTFRAGEVIAGRFRIERFIGEGGMGEVYAAEDLDLVGKVAVKTLRPVLSQNEELIRRFKQETQIARKVTHRNVSRVFDFFRHEVSSEGEGSSVAFLTMELLEGETLADRIHRGGPMRTPEAMPIVEQIALGLAAAHSAGIVHRDFKSGNILLVNEADGGPRAVIADFGLACAKEDLLATASGATELAGTVAYAAPEQLARGAVTQRSDIFSLGVVLFEIVTGELPFAGDGSSRMERLAEAPPSPRRFVPDLDIRWESTILQCLQPNPLLRFANAGEVLKQLQSRRISRRRILVGAAAGGAAAGLGWIWTRPKELQPEAVRSFKRGQDFAQRRNQPGLKNAIEEFRRAAGLEPGYLEAWIGLADAYSAMANFGFMDSRTALEEARQAASRAVAMDRRSGRALGALGYVTSLDVRNWLQAEPYFVRAVAADPKDATVRLWYGAHLSKLGRSDAAFQQLRAGLEQNPSSLILNQQLAVEYFRARRFPEFLDQARELVRLQPFEASSHFALARALEWNRRYAEALASCDEAQKYDSSVTSLCFRGSIEAALGNLTAARSCIEQVRDYWGSRPFQSVLLAGMYGQIGDSAAAVTVLNAGYDRGDSTVLTAPTNPYFDGIRNDAAYQQYCRRIGWKSQIATLQSGGRGARVLKPPPFSLYRR